MKLCLSPSLGELTILPGTLPRSAGSDPWSHAHRVVPGETLGAARRLGRSVAGGGAHRAQRFGIGWDGSTTRKLLHRMLERISDQGVVR